MMETTFTMKTLAFDVPALVSAATGLFQAYCSRNLLDSGKAYRAECLIGCSKTCILPRLPFTRLAPEPTCCDDSDLPPISSHSSSRLLKFPYILAALDVVRL